MTNRGAVGERPLIILPTYNERENLAPIVEQIRRQLPAATLWIIDDNSPDGTGLVADELAACDERVVVSHRPGKLGLGTAYAHAFYTALRSGAYDVVIQMDADFSHSPAYLPCLVAALQDADVVIGSRYTAGGGTQNWSRFRQAVSRGGNLIARLGLGVRVRDATGGFRAFRQETLGRLNYDDLSLRGYGFQIEAVYQLERQGLTVREVPIIFVERVAGRSKMSKGIALEAFLHILRRRWGMLTGRAAQPPAPEKTGHRT